MIGVPAAVLTVIPSPSQGVWYLGPLPIRAYALCILVGILVAIQLGERRWIERGGKPGAVLDIAAWAVPFGIVGGRLYHVATTWQPYFGAEGDPVKAFFIWEGGLGIWGAVALGGVGAWIGARRAGLLLPPLADALAPGIVLAQAIGRWGNWFNNELYGGKTDLPWALRIYDFNTSKGQAILGTDGKPVVKGLFHPAFLYESIWNVGIAAVLIWADRRFRLGHGRVFALYILLYTLGRGWIEALRVDPANRILGLRLNLWTSLLVGLGALAYLVISARLRPGRETSVAREAAVADVPDAEAADDEAPDDEAPDDEASDDEASDDETPEGKASDDETPDRKAPDDETPGDKTSDDKTSDGETPDGEAPDDSSEATTEELEAEVLRKAAAKVDRTAGGEPAGGKQGPAGGFGKPGAEPAGGGSPEGGTGGGKSVEGTTSEGTKGVRTVEVAAAVPPVPAKDQVVSLEDSPRKVSPKESVSTAPDVQPHDAQPGPGQAKEGVPADKGVPGSRISDAERSNHDS